MVTVKIGARWYLIPTVDLIQNSTQPVLTQSRMFLPVVLSKRERQKETRKQEAFKNLKTKFAANNKQLTTSHHNTERWITLCNFILYS